jgi:hypothetical protein
LKLPSGENRNLVLVRAGPRSLHQQWLSRPGTPQNFDLLVLAYGPTYVGCDRPDFGYIDAPGAKVAGYGEFLSNSASLVERYACVAMIDDDILTDSASISECFSTGERFGADLWQPSLTWDSYASYATLLRHPGQAPVRRVNFVEMMCPFFTSASLMRIRDLFLIGAETGIDVLWSAALAADGHSMAVLDNVSVKHTLPVGKLKAMNGFDPDIGYQQLVDELLLSFGIRFPGPKSLLTGDVLQDTALTLRSALVALAVLRTPLPKVKLARRWASAMRTLLIRSSAVEGIPAAILAEARVRAATRGCEAPKQEAPMVASRSGGSAEELRTQ